MLLWGDGSSWEEHTTLARGNFVIRKHQAHVSNQAEDHGLAGVRNSVTFMSC